MRRAIVGGLLVLVLTACSTATAFQSHYAAGRYGDAAAAFRADSTLHDDEEALYRMALVLSAPDSPVRDLERARITLHRLLELHPDGTRAREARVILGLLGDVRELRTQLEKMKAVDLEEKPSEEPPRRRR